MIEAADFVMVLVYPDTATTPTAGLLALIPPDAAGRRIIANWDTLGMRATRSDSLVLEECFVPDSSVIFLSDDIRPFRHSVRHLHGRPY